MINKDLGFIIPSLINNEECNAICELINGLVENNKKYQFCIFNQYNELPDTRLVPLMPISHAKYFDGDLLTFDFPSLVMAINFPLTRNINYLTNSAPWSMSYNRYSSWKNIFNKQNLRIFTNSKEISEVYNIAWNIKAKIIKEINHESIYQILS